MSTIATPEKPGGFSNYFRCLTASPGRAVGSWSWRGTSMVRCLISERSYPWALEPAGLNGSHLASTFG